MVAMSLKLNNLAGVEAAIAELAEATSSRTAKAALQRGMIDAAQPMVDRAKVYAPERSGRLSGSIIASARRKDPAKAVFAQVLGSGGTREQATAALRNARRAAKGTSPPVRVFVGPSGRYGRAGALVEFGTKPHTIKPRRKGKLQWPQAFGEPSGAAAEVHHPGTRPTRFLTRAYLETRDEVVQGIGDKVRAQLAKATARARAKGLRKGG